MGRQQNYNPEAVKSPTERLPREHPEKFLADADTLLSPVLNTSSSLVTSNNTPGVIGAQEVYNDPRARRLAEKNKNEQQGKVANQSGEKLSFKEKMKMFAKETGEANTPKDKIKTSRAQRDIEQPDGSP